MSRIREFLAGRRLLVGALVASLSVNLLVGGLIVGDALRPERAERPDRSDAVTLRHALRDAPDPVRAAVRDALRARRPAFLELQRELSGARSAAAEAAEAEPFDPEALRAALADVRAAQDRVAAFGHETLLELLPAMPPENRAAFARRFERMARDREHGRSEGGRPDRDGPQRGAP